MNTIVKGKEDEFREGSERLSTSAGKLDEILGKINEGEGTVGRLVSSDELYDEIHQFVKEIRENPWRLLKKK
jgi:hypothetical protein